MSRHKADVIGNPDVIFLFQRPGLTVSCILRRKSKATVILKTERFNNIDSIGYFCPTFIVFRSCILFCPLSISINALQQIYCRIVMKNVLIGGYGPIEKIFITPLLNFPSRGVTESSTKLKDQGSRPCLLFPSSSIFILCMLQR